MNIGDLIVIGLILGFVVILIYAGYYVDWWFHMLH